MTSDTTAVIIAKAAGQATTSCHRRTSGVRTSRTERSSSRLLGGAATAAGDDVIGAETLPALSIQNRNKDLPKPVALPGKRQRAHLSANPSHERIKPGRTAL